MRSIVFYLLLFITIYTIFYIINLKYYKLYEEKINITKIIQKDYFLDKKNIPKIIHQTAPSDKKKWNNIWIECQKTWFLKFPSPEYKYMMWNDEDLENLIKIDFPWFYQIYISYDKKIKQIDIARNFILYKYGGIYADMDYMCMQNFYNLLPYNVVSICESPYKKWENVQNALMASPIEHPFWLKLIDEAKKHINDNNVLKSTGPILLTNICAKYPEMVNILEVKYYNPLKGTPEFNDPNVKTKHFGTFSWK
jgi:mannosyltransferase OCH1-like enzyme